MGSRLKKSKLTLIDDRFDVLNNREEDLYGVRMNRKNIISRMFRQNSFFFINNGGEHWMQNRTMLAVFKNYKMKDASGKETNLYDAYETYTDSEGIPGLRIKAGYTKADGSKFTENDEFQVKNRVKGINQRLHGIYNREDMNALQRQ
jgi:hypothetical protein